MLNLPRWMITIVTNFAPAILTTGKRTVSAALRVMGLGQARNYAQYHHVLSRAKWSGLEVSANLLRLLLKASTAASHWCLASTKR